jgi:hypothetical protein
MSASTETFPGAGTEIRGQRGHQVLGMVEHHRLQAVDPVDAGGHVGNAVAAERGALPVEDVGD